MMEELLKIDLLGYINAKRPENLPEWTAEPVVQTESISDKVFDIVDLRDGGGTIKRPVGAGEATYFNGDDRETYTLHFVRYEYFINQFRTFDGSGRIIGDWGKGMSRPDYLVYDSGESKQYFIIHELSSGTIKNKRKDGKLQLLNTVRVLCEQEHIWDYIQHTFKNLLCFISARDCVGATPSGMADGFMEIYKHLPEPIPFHNATIEKRGFHAFESKVVKL